MATCEQTSGQTILEHGYSVAITYRSLFISRIDQHKLPDILRDNLDFLQSRIVFSNEELETYHIFHDCAKPNCLTIDKEGRRHFPNHALMSARAWLVAGGDARIGKLIEHDLDFHKMKPADLHEYKHLDLAPALLLTAWAEIHSNCTMFGGIESTSFKIKAKNLIKLSKALIAILKEKS
jgi:hypothetical protein